IVQRVSVAELFAFAEQLERSPETAVVYLRHSLATFRDEQSAAEKQLMNKDCKLIFEPPVPSPLPEIPVLDQVLLTGGTGFIGPFLMKSLLEQTKAKLHVIVRSSDEKQGMQRLRTAMESMGSCDTRLMEMFEARVIPVCGDLSQPGLGLTQEMWYYLADK